MDKLRIVLAAREHEGLARFAAGLWQDQGVALIHVDSAEKAMDQVRKQDIALIVVGEDLADMQAIEFVTHVVKTWPMLNTAMVSSLSSEDFHEYTEGLGILMQLPVNPSGDDAAALLHTLHALNTLLDRQIQTGVVR